MKNPQTLAAAYVNKKTVTIAENGSSMPHDVKFNKIKLIN
jgi:hypothetical protein